MSTKRQGLGLDGKGKGKQQTGERARSTVSAGQSSRPRSKRGEMMRAPQASR
jgi:hypothetical protein